MATETQRAEVLYITNQLNALRVKRNRTRIRSRKQAIQVLIDAGEADKKAKCKKYGLPYSGGLKGHDASAYRK